MPKTLDSLTPEEIDAMLLERRMSLAQRAARTYSAIDEANALATAESRQTAQAQAGGGATAQAHAFSLTTTADALTSAQPMARATATADFEQVMAAQQRQAASATALALGLCADFAPMLRSDGATMASVPKASTMPALTLSAR